MNTGSSPRVWGQVPLLEWKYNLKRIIPTRVGTSSVYRCRNGIFGDHPHACGDKLIPARRNVALKGSSPRVWGQVIDDTSLPLNLRIIPTRVGTRFVLVLYSPFGRDHPHACGDKHCLLLSQRREGGSSPRVWGQDFLMPYVLTLPRIIPTRVGTRCHYSRLSKSRRDHPHACGDKRLLVRSFRPTRGSSPRVWGQVYPA